MSELECEMIISGIIMAIGIAIFLAMVIVQSVDYPYEYKLNKRYVIEGLIGIIIFVICLPIFIRSCKIYYSPELSHKRLVNDLDKVEKELQKFYIDYPEFKENENEIY